jgi:hypothetical protein
MIWIGLSLVVASLGMRLAGVVVFRVLCGTYWSTLFDPIPGQTPTPRDSVPLFPGLSPADFDELIKRRRAILRDLPPNIARLAWWRLGLRNWSRAMFWIGVLALVGSAVT